MIVIPFNSLYAINVPRPNTLNFNLRWSPQFYWRIRGSAPEDFKIRLNSNPNIPNPFTRWHPIENLFSPAGQQQLDASPNITVVHQGALDLDIFGRRDEILRIAIENGTKGKLLKEYTKDGPAQGTSLLLDVAPIYLDQVLSHAMLICHNKILERSKPNFSIQTNPIEEEKKRIMYLQELKALDIAFKNLLIERLKQKDEPPAAVPYTPVHPTHRLLPPPMAFGFLPPFSIHPSYHSFHPTPPVFPNPFHQTPLMFVPQTFVQRPGPLTHLALPPPPVTTTPVAMEIDTEEPGNQEHHLTVTQGRAKRIIKKKIR